MPSLLNKVSSRSTVSKDYKCTVQLLDDTQTMTVDFKKNDVGQVVLDYVCDMMNIVEKDYFGLRYVDTNRHRYWLDTTKQVLRQVKSGSIVFAFRVKFYPSDPTIVKEELTRYLLALQLKRDLLHGRLYCPQSDASVLGAYILQGEIGDYDPMEHTGNYVSQFKMFLNQTPKLEEKIALEHQKLKGRALTPSDADLQFLKKACALDTYGYYPYTIKDPKAGQVYMGATPHGVLVYQTHRKLHHIKWDDVKDFDYVGKDFYIYPSQDYLDDANVEFALISPEREHELPINVDNGGQRGTNGSTPAEPVQNHLDNDHHHIDHHSKSASKKRAALRFICPSATFSKHLWKYMLAQQAFFTKPKSNEVRPIAIRRGPLFRRATFRYAGRVLQEIKEAPSPKRAEPSFDRTHLPRQMPRDERNAPWANKFHTLPRATKPIPESIENQTAPAVSKEAPERVDIRDSLTLDTTAQATPIITPIIGLSPSLINGPSAADTSTSTTAEESFSSTRITTQKTTVVAGSYKQDIVTVSLKHVEPTQPENELNLGNELEKELQRPLSTSTPLPSDAEQKILTRKDDVKFGASVTSAEPVSRKPKFEPSRSSTNAASASITEPSLKTVQQHQRAGQGFGRALIRTVLSGVMFTILMIGTIIVIMEVQDPQFRGYVRRVPGSDAFRHQYYEPSRQNVLDWYQRMAGRRDEYSE